jgi:flagellar motility protein MotE (MotC chaperone)
VRKDWHVLLAMKGLGLLALGGLVFHLSSKGEGFAFTSEETQNSAKESVDSQLKGESNARQLDGSGEGDLPEIPVGQTTLSNAAQIRNQLILVKKSVQEKIKALAQSKASLEKTRAKVSEELKMLSEQKAIMEESLQNEKKVKEDRIKEALTFIEKMEPRKAAPLIEAMDRDLVVALFKRLPARNVTRVLENVSAKKATELMEYYTRIRSGREYELLKELGLCQTDSTRGSDSSSKKLQTALANASPTNVPTPATNPSLPPPEVSRDPKPNQSPSPSPVKIPAADKAL